MLKSDKNLILYISEETIKILGDENMILLFGEKAQKTNSARRSSNIKNHPVENSGILANRSNVMPSLLDANEYDMYMFSVQADIDYSKYADSLNPYMGGYTSEYSIAMNGMSDCSSYVSSFTGDGSFSGSSVGGSFGGGSFGGSCGGFSSVG